MDEAKALQALLLAQQAEKQMAASQQLEYPLNTLQPRPDQMGAINHPYGQLSSPNYSVFNRV
jgi:hypothetical protein